MNKFKLNKILIKDIQLRPVPRNSFHLKWGCKIQVNQSVFFNLLTWNLSPNFKNKLELESLDKHRSYILLISSAFATISSNEFILILNRVELEAQSFLNKQNLDASSH